MQIVYDKETDTLNITFMKGQIVDSEYIEDKGVVVDYDDEDRVLGVEILSYSKKFLEGFNVDLPIEAVKA
jgi:uncharacterized protein YuzE